MRQEHKRGAGVLVLAALLLAWPGARGVVADVVASHVTVANTATLLATADGDGTGVLVRNAGTASIFLGGSGVTTPDGFELVVGAAAGFQLGPGETLYGIVASGTETAHVIRTGSS